MSQSFHPLQIMPFLLWGGLFFAFLMFVMKGLQRQAGEFSFSGLVLVGWLTIFSFMSGFSIGLYVAMINIAIGISLVLLTSHFRSQLTYAVLSNILLVSFMRGTIPDARLILILSSLGGLIFSVVKLLEFKKQKNEDAFAKAGLAVLSLLFFLSLLLQNYIVAEISCIALAIVFGLAFTLIAKHYRGYFAVMSTMAIVWATIIYWQLRFGN